MTADELLERVSARELTEWAAYEQVCGPIGPEWRDESAAVLIEEMRSLSQTLVAVNVEKKDRERLPPVERYQRPDGHVPQPQPGSDDTDDLDDVEDDEE